MISGRKAPGERLRIFWGPMVGKDKKNKKEKKDKKSKKSPDKQKKGKHKKKDQSKVPAQPAAFAAPVDPAVIDQTYADGAPLDKVTYLEAKLILKPDRFTSVQSFRDFGKVVQKMAKEVGVGFIADPEASLRPEIREITFGDTPTSGCTTTPSSFAGALLMSMASPSAIPNSYSSSATLTSKAAAAVDVRPKIAGTYRIKFKAEVLPLKDEVGGYRILYSHNCQFGSSQMHDADRTSIATLIKVFPGARQAGKGRERADQPGK